MKRTASADIKRGQAISFRVPSDTPDNLLRQLQKLKDTERRNFSSKIAEFVMQGVGDSYKRERETITIPLPHMLNKSQRNWLKHEHSLALLGSIIYQLLNDPVRATALLASLNSNATDIDQALYLQEETIEKDPHLPFGAINTTSVEETAAARDQFDDLENFNWETVKPSEQEHEEENEEENGEENDLDDLLGGFLSKMNK